MEVGGLLRIIGSHWSQEEDDDEEKVVSSNLKGGLLGEDEGSWGVLRSGPFRVDGVLLHPAAHDVPHHLLVVMLMMLLLLLLMTTVMSVNTKNDYDDPR
jgi:hypothetical protein